MTSLLLSAISMLNWTRLRGHHSWIIRAWAGARQGIGSSCPVSKQRTPKYDFAKFKKPNTFEHVQTILETELFNDKVLDIENSWKTSERTISKFKDHIFQDCEISQGKEPWMTWESFDLIKKRR